MNRSTTPPERMAEPFRAGGVATNPFLPLGEYIPDGEPHVFGDRVYLFGSHDSENGSTYCELDYVFYSAPINDLSAWTTNGVSYRANQDPDYGKKRRYMYAPDVVQGNDGRFYLYYCMSGEKGRGGYAGPIRVAVADQPDGRYEYLGHVRNPDGSPYDEYVLFDPAVINDNGTIRLYYGACYPFAEMPRFSRPLARLAQSMIFGKSLAQIKARPDGIQGAITVELDDDMLTVRTPPARIIPEDTRGTTFHGHAFWEASSIRRIDDTYYLIYSSIRSHELCYATSSHPDRDFVFRGTIISNGDIGLHGRTPRDRINQTGTNHGSIERIGHQWYVFYHRNTHGSKFRRQACAEPITIEPDGSIPQVPVTSSGPNNGPLPTDREYPAIICSTLSNGKMGHGAIRSRRLPRIDHDQADRYISHITHGTTIGYRSFRFTGPTRITLTTRGPGTGRINIGAEDSVLASATITPSAQWSSTGANVHLADTQNLWLRYEGDKNIDLVSLAFHTPRT